MGTPADRLPDEVLLAGLGVGDADLAIAFVRRFQQLVFGVAVTVIGDRGAAPWPGCQLSRPGPWRWPASTA